MYADTRRHVQKCEVCQMHGRSPSEAPIAGHITANRPGEAWVVDVLHMLPSDEGHVASVKVLKPYYASDSTPGSKPDQAKTSTTTKYDVVEIRDDRGQFGVDKEFLIHWGSKYSDTWEPEENLDCPAKLQQYLRSKARQEPDLRQSSSKASDDAKPPWAVTITLDLLQLQAEKMTTEICDRVGITTSDVAAQLAPVPCETYSIAGYSNESRGHHYRCHSHPDKPPREDRSLKRTLAKKHDQLVKNILVAWENDRRKGSKQRVFMENPRGFLQHRPFMRRATKTGLKLSQHLVHYCAYGSDFKKPTQFWTNAEWTPRGRTGDGLCHQQCGKGSVQANGKFKHFRGHAQEPIRGPRGQGANRIKNEWPQELTQELIEVIEAERAKGSNTIIDLCAGYQSSRDAILAAGFNYVAVDLRGDRNQPRLTPVA